MVLIQLSTEKFFLMPGYRRYMERFCIKRENTIVV
jgi:hypothetical protein